MSRNESIEGASEPISFRSRICWPLVAIMILAGLVRFIGLKWGLPHVWTRPDEEILTSMALKYGTGDLNPHFFGYPSLYSYVVFVGYAGLVVFWKLTGVVASSGDILTKYAQDPTAFILVQRLISATAGTATVFVIDRLGARAFDKRVGLASAFVMAVTLLSVRDSHFGVTDTTMAFFMALTVLAAWSVFENGGTKSYIAAGIALGLAVTTKYPAVPASLAIAAAHFLRPGPERGFRPHHLLILAALVSLLAFIAGTPFSVLSVREFLELRNSSSVRAQYGELDVTNYRLWQYLLMYTLPQGMTWPLFVAAVCGVFGIACSGWRRAVLLLAAPVGYCGLVGWSWATPARYAIPLIPFLALFAGWALTRLGEIVASFLPRRLIERSGLVVAIVVGLACLPSMFEVGWLLRHMTSEDSREAAVASIKERFPNGATIGYMGSPFARPHLPLTPESWDALAEFSKTRGGTGSVAKKKAELARSTPGPKFTYVEIPKKTDPADFKGELPEYLLVSRYPVFPEETANERLPIWLERGPYDLVETWPVTKNGRPIPFCDQQDALYLPLGALSGVTRSGPELTLYRRKPRQ
jgi:Dolichyl-phosphate-mannose-protein mannosyltransferase